MVFHHPGPINQELTTGSKVRPTKLLNAFYSQGFEVEIIAGYARQRNKAISKVISQMRQGRKFSFVYSESRSIPTLLTEKHRLPSHPLLDLRFLQRMRTYNVPTGLYYRDIFWRFPFYKAQQPLPLRLITTPLYWYDWFGYQKSVDHLFLPSIGMTHFLPTPWPMERLSALPPGATATRAIGTTSKPHENKKLRLIYVGGVTPPVYNLQILLQLVARLPQLELTLCCRKPEWTAIESFYRDFLSEKVNVTHESGDSLKHLYANSDIAAIVWEKDEYLDFAVPVKLFEAIGYGVPILCMEGSEAARIVAREKIGWVVRNLNEAEELLYKIASDRSLLPQIIGRVTEAAERNSWEARVTEIEAQLTKYSGPPNQ